MSLTGPDWCAVIRVPTALTWNNIDQATIKEQDARASRVLKASGVEVKPPNLTTVEPETTVVRWSK